MAMVLPPTPTEMVWLMKMETLKLMAPTAMPMDLEVNIYFRLNHLTAIKRGIYSSIQLHSVAVRYLLIRSVNL